MTALAITRRNANPYLPVESDEATMHSEIEAVVNGNLDKSNFSPVTAVPVTSLVGLAVRKGKVAALRVNMNGPANYQTIRFIYDDVLGKWVSAPVLWFHQQADLSVTNTSYVDVPANTEINEAWLTNNASLYNAGVRPQVWIGAKLTGPAGGTTKVRVRIVEIPAGAGFGNTTYLEPGITHNNTTPTYKISDWHTCDIQTVPTDTGGSAIFVVDVAVTTGTGTVSQLNAYLRWVSA